MKLRRIIERDHGVIQVPPTRWRITLGFLSVLSVPLRLGRAKVSPPASFARFLWRGSTSATSQAAAGSERHSLTLQRGIPLQQRPHSLATAAVIAGQVVRSQVARTNLPRPQT